MAIFGLAPFFLVPPQSAGFRSSRGSVDHSVLAVFVDVSMNWMSGLLLSWEPPFGRVRVRCSGQEGTPSACHLYAGPAPGETKRLCATLQEPSQVCETFCAIFSTCSRQKGDECRFLRRHRPGGAARLDGIIINNRYTLVPDMPGLFETITYSFLSYLGSNRPGTPGTEL